MFKDEKLSSKIILNTCSVEFIESFYKDSRVLMGNVDSTLWSLTGCKGSKLCCKMIHSHEFHKNCICLFKNNNDPSNLQTRFQSFKPCPIELHLSGPLKTSQEHAGPLKTSLYLLIYLIVYL